MTMMKRDTNMRLFSIQYKNEYVNLDYSTTDYLYTNQSIFCSTAFKSRKYAKIIAKGLIALYNLNKNDIKIIERKRKQCVYLVKKQAN